ncbi:hypothetical protein PHYBOEH_006738 [Phytophthora boehmeriae]|uniref:Myb-like domain-containing protein n=1 Tax=Phytophthora boehmeriae TaxID=109152 RepID=A0A8T1X8X1_9STRA|nr:hypothetical protein PHYBOEH_006738 [Phytophthora boehmeriae]
MQTVAKQERWSSAEVQRLLELRFHDGPEAQLFRDARGPKDKRQAWDRISERLHVELPLPNGDERSSTQCEQKLNNLRKEYVRLSNGQVRRDGFPAYWQLLKDTVGNNVATGAAASPSSLTSLKERAKPPVKSAKRPREGQDDQQQPKKQRENSMISASDFSLRPLSGQVGGDDVLSIATTEHRSAKKVREPSAQILQSVKELNKLVAEFVASDKDSAAGDDMERRLAKVESGIALLHASVEGMTNKMDRILAVISGWDIPDRSAGVNDTDSD